MNKTKLSLALVLSIAGVAALSACADVTAQDGVVLSYTDSNGNRVDYRASELLDSYEDGSGAASTNFSKVKEILIRKYYNTIGGSTLSSLQTRAQNEVDGVKKQAQTNATNNKTNYGTELETLLKSNNVKNINELYEAKLYSLEQDEFKQQFQDDEALLHMETGSANDEGTKAYFPADEKFGRGSDGYLNEKVPYHVSHFLVKFSSSSHNEASEFTISSDESKKVSSVVKAFAGASNDSKGVTSLGDNRMSFGDIAYTFPSDDEGSAKDYSNLGLMEDGYVPEFRLGVFAADALYNDRHYDEAYYNGLLSGNEVAGSKFATETVKFGDDKPTGESRVSHILPSADDKIGTTDTKTLQYFIDRGIGTIPYGAAVALGYTDVANDPNLGYSVNDGSATYYPRNVLFNKYFNNRSVAVIVPESIPFNDYYENKNAVGGDSSYNWGQGEAVNFIAQEKAARNEHNGFYSGTYSASYAALPGFQVDTHDVLPNLPANENALTNERGQIILAVRVSNGSGNAYEGVHFIVVNRSSLDAYMTYDSSVDVVSEKKSRYTYSESKPSDYDSIDSTSLSDYFTFQTPGNAAFPTYSKSGVTKDRSTFVNRLTTSQNSNYNDTANKIRSAIKSYNTSEDTFEFQSLLSPNGTDYQGLKFNTDTVLGQKFQDKIESYVYFTREKNHEDAVKTLDDAWDSYAETLQRQDEDRDMGEKGEKRLISESVAITYWSEYAREGTGMYDTNGAGYDGKK